ncbi:MAG TPA: YbaK/EbsC family protein [Nitrospiria bacterium]|nr:YbaK/EbsC family protein [Nitrospiria bacterium]
MLTFEIKNRMRLRNWWKGYEERREAGAAEMEWPTAPEHVKAYLRNENVPYRLIPHREAFTSPEVAASIHVSGRKVAKVVMVWADDRYVMAVLPSHRPLDLARFAEVLGAFRVSLAPEAVLDKLFPDCEVGAMPPFGHLYQFQVYVDESLTREPEIFFQPGTHREVIAIRYEDFKRLVRPETARFTSEPMKRADGF